MITHEDQLYIMYGALVSLRGKDGHSKFFPQDQWSENHRHRVARFRLRGAP